MSDQEKKHVVILGGSAEAYMAAWSIRQQFRKDQVAVTVLDAGGAQDDTAFSLQEESLPIFARFGINEKTLVESVSSSYKLGTRFDHWTAPDASVFQPIGTHGGNMDLVSFESFAVKKSQLDGALDYNAYSLGAQAALSGKFVHPQTGRGTIVSTLGYALHLDGNDLGAWLKARCIDQGVQVTPGRVTRVDRDSGEGLVSSLQLDDGNALAVDLLIDCSNAAQGPLSEAFPVRFESWARYFANDRRMTFTTPAREGWQPFTRVSAHANGVVRQSPFESSVLGDFYFSSERLGEREALNELQRIEPEADSTSTASTFSPGIRESAWVGNYVALGKSYGQYEPLDASNFHGFLVALERLLDLFPRTDDCRLESFEFNRRTRLWYENMRDHNLMRHRALRTSDIQAALVEDLPASFRHKFELFGKTARMPYFEEEPFSEPYRVSAYLNMGFWPEAYNPSIDRFSFEELDQRFEEMKRMIAETVAAMPNHLDYVKRLLASQS